MIRRLTGEELTLQELSQLYTLELDCGLEPYSPEMLMACVSQFDTYACFRDGRIIGFITVNPRGRYVPFSLYIMNLNVSRKYRRQGIATALLGYAAEQFSDRLRVTLDVTRDNPAMTLYQELGFQITDIPSGNGPGDVVMTAKLRDMLGRISER